jgi:hypothetical protein
MKDLMKSNDMVTLSFVEALLRDANIPFQSLDHNMSILDGSIGILPRRILVDEVHQAAARSILTDAGLADEIVEQKGKS